MTTIKNVRRSRRRGSARRTTSQLPFFPFRRVTAMLPTKLKVSVVLFAGACALVLGGATTVADERPRVPAPNAQPKDRVRAKDTEVKGKLESVDTEKKTITITISMFDRNTKEATETKKTFPLAKDAKV